MTRDLDVSVASNVSVLSIFHVMQFHKYVKFYYNITSLLPNLLTSYFAGYQAMLALQVMRRQTKLPNLH